MEQEICLRFCQNARELRVSCYVKMRPMEVKQDRAGWRVGAS